MRLVNIFQCDVTHSYVTTRTMYEYIYMNKMYKYTYMNASCNIWMSHVTYEYVTKRIHMCDTMNESCHTCVCYKTHSHVWHDEWVMSHMCMLQNAFTCVTWWMSHVTYEYITKHNHMCNIWISHVTYEYVTKRIHVCDMMNESRHIWICYKTHSHVWHDEWVTSHMYMLQTRRNHLCDMIHSHTCINPSVVAWHPKENWKNVWCYKYESVVSSSWVILYESSWLIVAWHPQHTG